MANEIARKLRKNLARHEVRLQLRLRELRKLGFHFRGQASIKSFVVDFACSHPIVVVQLDGSQHSRRRQELKDAARDLALGANVFFFKQKTAYEIGLGIPAEPLFRSKSAADKGKDTRDYLAAAFPELNAWERAGADASSAGMVDAGFENQKELTKMQLDNQKEIAEMQNETQKEIAGIQS